jgi:hypothetical protein
MDKVQKIVTSIDSGLADMRIISDKDLLIAWSTKRTFAQV